MSPHSLTGPLGLTLEVTDVPRSVTFYREILGFAFEGYWAPKAQRVVSSYEDAGRPPYAEVSLGSIRIGLHRAPAPPVPADRSSYTLRARDIEGFYAHLKDRGFETRPPTRQPWGDAILEIADPDGHRWTLVGKSEL